MLDKHIRMTNIKKNIQPCSMLIYFKQKNILMAFSDDPLLSLSLSNCQTQNEQPVNCIL